MCERTEAVPFGGPCSHVGSPARRPIALGGSVGIDHFSFRNDYNLEDTFPWCKWAAEAVLSTAPVKMIISKNAQGSCTVRSLSVPVAQLKRKNTAIWLSLAVSTPCDYQL